MDMPAQPTGLTASAGSSAPVSLQWADPSDDSITGYKILRRSRDGDTYGDGQGAREFVEIATTADAVATYVDTSVAAGRRYVYRVVAVNAADDSPRSSYANVGRHSWSDGQEALR